MQLTSLSFYSSGGEKMRLLVKKSDTVYRVMSPVMTFEPCGILLSVAFFPHLNLYSGNIVHKAREVLDSYLRAYLALALNPPLVMWVSTVIYYAPAHF